MSTPPTDDNPFRTPDYATAPAPMPPPAMAPAPGYRPIPHWFTTKVRITLAACVVLALGLGALGALGIARLGRSGTPSSGDCLYLTRESGGKLAYHRVSCGSGNATYKVDDSHRGTSRCASGDYVRFQISGSGSGAQTLCLALNVSTGDCLRDVDDQATVAKVACTDPAAKERAEVIAGYRGEDSCADADHVLSYPGPPRRTVCLAPPGENI
ncbi:LppU/SCO3897 family protein [Amycolatopsis australiensis]|uniref:Uncharacterized protein n=1 Tax=Amycolatopsis australiensis TaxID=546364 RepID=A0A1K1QNH9_9PSEU|nr:hypothetical protein [Amycolatopsis australiensis]SFW61456.1 hypothetical protein SAMN04489730_2021 [Amycolatopsis australiensis]